MTKHYDEGDPGFELLRPQGSRSTTQQRTGIVERHDLSGVDVSWGARRRGRALGRALEAQTGGLRVMKRYAEAATGFENANQELQQARARRALLPLFFEQERSRLETEIAKGRGALEAAVDLNLDMQARRLERRELEAETHTLELARKRRLILEEQIAIQQLEDALKKGKSPPVGGGSGAADPLRDYLKTEAEVHQARSAAARVADAIRNASAAQGRELTQDERNLIEMYESAAAAAEEEIRRGGAADF